MATDLSALDIVGANKDVKAASPGKSINFHNIINKLIKAKLKTKINVLYIRYR